MERHQHGDRTGAGQAYREALGLEPDLPGAVMGLSMLLLESGGQDEAEPMLERLVGQYPLAGLPRSLLGQALLRQGHPAEAETQLRRALRADPALVAAHLDLAECLELRGEPGMALTQYDLAQALDPLAPQIPARRAETRQHLGQYAQAEAGLRQALALDPAYLPAQFNLAMLLLLEGRLAEGWEGRDLRWEVTHTTPRSFKEPLWDGLALHGRTILLHGAQEGLGDAIMALRYAAPLKQLGARVLVECDPSLAGVFRTCPWADEIISHGDPLPPFHCQAPLMSLPRLFDTTLETIPRPIPYLGVPPGPPTPRQRLGEERLAVPARLKVGLVHAGNPGHVNDANRSIPPSELAPLGQLGPDIAFFSLQKTREALPALPGSLGAVDLGDLLGDFTDTARALARLDLVISVDTAVAHLAGAMGKPVMLLLPFVPEWRWLLDREDSPWYPGFRLFRQSKPGLWEEVVARIQAALLDQLRGTC
jgi:hypothetical protein